MYVCNLSSKNRQAHFQLRFNYTTESSFYLCVENKTKKRLSGEVLGKFFKIKLKEEYYKYLQFNTLNKPVSLGQPSVILKGVSLDDRRIFIL